MKKSWILLLLFTYGCIYSEKKNSYKEGHNGTTSVDTSPTIEKKDDSELIKIIEHDFFNNIKQYDKENHTKAHLKFKEIFKKSNIQPYDLYLQLTEINKTSEERARKAGIEIRADGRERKTEKYYQVLRNTKEEKLFELQTKYNLTNQLLHQFKSNFCFCYQGKEDKYCNNGTCTLVNGEYWK